MPIEHLTGDCIDVMKKLKAESVHCCVTSPPYWGLRDYGIESTKWPSVSYTPMSGVPEIAIPRMECCLGLEPTPEAFIGHIILVFREASRVLRDDGTLWLNLGDTYAGSWGAMSCPGGSVSGRRFGANSEGDIRRPVSSRLSGGLKSKDLVGIPWRAALAMQADGWYLRSDVIWNKPNPMPESAKDRPSKAHE